MTNLNKKLLVSATKENLKEIQEEKEIDSGSNNGEFRFKDESSKDPSRAPSRQDKSSTRYDAKFIEEDDMNYDPEIVTPQDTSALTDNQTPVEEVLNDQPQMDMVKAEVKILDEQVPEEVQNPEEEFTESQEQFLKEQME